MRRRRLTLIAIAVLLVLAGLYTAGWFYARDVVLAELDRQMAAADRQGITVERFEPRVTGFPFSMGVEADAVQVSHDTGLSWNGTGLDGWVSVFAPTTARIDMTAPQEFTFRPVAGGPPITVSIAGARGFATTDFDGSLERAQIDVDDIVFDALGVPEMRVSALRANAVQGVDDTAPEALGADILLQDVAVTPSPLPQLGTEIDAILADIIVIGPLPRDPNRQELAAWRDAGGRLRIESAGLDWGDVDIRISGDLVLDENLQPEGTLEVVLHGHSQLLAAAVDAGLVGSAEAGVASFGLSALSSPGEDGRMQVRAPLSIAHQEVRLGGIPLPLRLPAIQWPR
ncbi:MAG: DUF2125 domain-containing protein [Rhodospirillaceae bacterium]|nr:DUF2125 domain-containing protein [Rhodospirillaceae bacterium]